MSEQTMSGTSGRTNGEKSISAGRRLALALLVGLVAGAVAAMLGKWGLAPLVAWDITVLTYGLWMWLTIWPLDSKATKRLATREDPGRNITHGLLLVASIVSLAAVGLVIVQAGSSSGLVRGLEIGLGVLSVVLSWAMVHTVFTLHYAKLYYGDAEGGIDFGKEPPQYSDFAYLAFTLGMTFQVSDTSLQSQQLRVTGLRHALLSYMFGTVIVATTINLIAGLGK